MVRLAGLRFSPGPGGPADRQLRSAREKLYYIGLQTHYSLEACCSEDQSLLSLFGGVSICVQKFVLESARWQNFPRLRRGCSPRG
mmetsp:Transcript_22754/g.64829  ORF Transcript_22754/g.64829 Transcript_22754/m.64829 type:complete len:85 (+) Transcript_22754:750-1004(+)